MADGIKPAAAGRVPVTTNSAPAPESTPIVDIPGAVTNRSWAPTDPVKSDDAAKFESKSSKAPGWGSLLGSTVSAGLRLMVGKLKEVPVLGNVLNLVDAGMDAASLAGKLITGKGTTAERLKLGADLVAHTVGIFKPSVGAEYDKGQAKMRLAIVGVEAGAKLFGIEIPPHMREWAPVLSAGYGGMKVFLGKNEDGSDKGPGVLATLGIAAGGAFVLPKLGDLASKLLPGGN